MPSSTTAPAREETPASPRASRAHPLPGLGACLAAGALALGVGALVPGLSPLLVAIVLGVAVANGLRLPDALAPGVAIAGKRVLRVGIVLLGLQLSLREVAGLGPGVLGLAVAVVAAGIASGLLVGRLLRLPVASTLLVSCGFSICGAAAVAAVDGVIDADEEDVATAIALVVVFGTLAIPLVPLLGSALGLDLPGRGVLVGASVHEVAQVVAAAGIVGQGALATAVLVKLSRVLLLAPVMAGVSLWRRRQAATTDGHRPPVVPLFVAGFLGCVALRSAVDLPAGLLAFAGTTQTFLLATAMFALGLGVHASALRRIGPRPLVLAASTTGVVTAVAAAGAVLLS